MVVQKTIDNLKDRPQDERKAVAGGVAIVVVVVLLVAWGFMFLRKINKGTQDINFDSGAQEEFNFSNVREAQQAIEQSNGGLQEDFSTIPQQSAEQQYQGQVQYLGDENASQFGN